MDTDVRGLTVMGVSFLNPSCHNQNAAPRMLAAADAISPASDPFLMKFVVRWDEKSRSLFIDNILTGANFFDPKLTTR